MLQPSFVHVQIVMIQRACWQKNREPFITALLDCDPALLRIEPLPRSSALVHALDYGNAHLLPVLTRIWPLPDDLPHAAGAGNATAVARWFDATGQPILGSLAHHHPGRCLGIVEEKCNAKEDKKEALAYTPPQRLVPKREIHSLTVAKQFASLLTSMGCPPLLHDHADDEAATSTICWPGSTGPTPSWSRTIAACASNLKQCSLDIGWLAN